MIRTGVIAKGKLKKERSLRICPKSGAVRSAVPVRKVLSAWAKKYGPAISGKTAPDTGIAKRSTACRFYTVRPFFIHGFPIRDAL
jgi:hypothetical protein